jgi:hypothetical protein
MDVQAPPPRVSDEAPVMKSEDNKQDEWRVVQELWVNIKAQGGWVVRGCLASLGPSGDWVASSGTGCLLASIS